MLSDEDIYEPGGGPPAPGSVAFGLAALLAGAALGAATTLLLTSKSAQQLREEVAGRAADWKAQAAEAIAHGREKVVSAVEGGLNSIPDTADEPSRQPTKPPLPRNG